MSLIAHRSGKIRPPTAKCGSTYCSCRLCSPIVSVSVCASAVAPAAVAGAALNALARLAADPTFLPGEAGPAITEPAGAGV